MLAKSQKISPLRLRGMCLSQAATHSCVPECLLSGSLVVCLFFANCHAFFRSSRLFLTHVVTVWRDGMSPEIERNMR
jgi:hypothetical protein